MKKNVKMKGVFLKHVKIVVSKDASVFIGPKTVIENSKFIIDGSGSILSIAGGCSLIRKSIIITNQSNGIVTIGSGFTTEGCKLTAHEGRSITIGNDCMFSSGIKISTTDYHSIISEGKRINPSKDIHIGNHVWLCQDVSILKGVKIADDVVVGSHSVVTKSLLQPQSVYVGFPPRLIRSNITWQRPMI